MIDGLLLAASVDVVKFTLVVQSIMRDVLVYVCVCVCVCVEYMFWITVSFPLHSLTGSETELGVILCPSNLFARLNFQTAYGLLLENIWSMPVQ